MKKFIAIIIAVILSTCSFSAFAAGFDGLGMNTNSSSTSSELPDPAQALDVFGTLVSSNYEFSEGYVCNVYAYEKPNNTSAFIDKYSGICRQAGYTVTEATIDGQNGFTIQSGDGLYAMLFPSVNDQILFMVQTGMDFTLKTRINYATCVYNNREYEYTKGNYGSDTYYFYNGVDVWDIMLHAEGNAPHDWISLDIPMYISEGDEFYVTDGDVIPGFGLMIPSGYLLEPIGDSNYHVRGYDDFAHLVITRYEETDRGVLIEGVFNGSFDEGEMVFENLTFSVIVRD